MSLLSLALSLVLSRPAIDASVTGENVRVRAIQSGPFVSLYFDLNGADGRYQAVAKLDEGGSSLLMPLGNVTQRLEFRSAEADGDELWLEGDGLQCAITVPKKGSAISVWLRDGRKFKKGSSLFALQLLDQRVAAKAITSFLPSRSGSGVAPFERLMCPVGLIATSDSGFAIVPSVEVIEGGTPINPVLFGSFGEGSILAYGFLPIVRQSDGSAVASGGGLDYAGDLVSDFSVVLGDAKSLARQTLNTVDDVTSRRRRNMPFPQTVPFEHYTRITYSSISTPNVEENDPIYALPLDSDGNLYLESGRNVARFAWGARWWGTKQGQPKWKSIADAVIKCVITTKPSAASIPVVFKSGTGTWSDGPFDASVLSETARYVLRYVDQFSDFSDKKQAGTYLQSAAGALIEHPPTGASTAFMQEYSASHQCPSRLRAKILARLEDIEAVGLSETVSDYRTIEGAATILAISRLDESGAKELARSLLETVYLGQAVWHPWTLGGIDVFGSLVSEHLQSLDLATMSSDLFDAAIVVGDKDLAERAVRVARSPLALIKVPTLGEFQSRLPADLPFPFGVSWLDYVEGTMAGPQVDIPSGLGQCMTTFAYFLENYGSAYVHQNGWTVCTDGLLHTNGKTLNAFSANPIPYSGPFDYIVLDSKSGDSKIADNPESHFAISRLKLEIFDGRPWLIAVPGFTSKGSSRPPTGRFLFADGTSAVCKVLPTGIGAEISPSSLAAGPVNFVGTIHGLDVSFGPVSLLVGPPKADAIWPQGWKRLEGLADGFDKQLLENKTDDLTTGAPTNTGVIESAPFLLNKNGISFTLLGSADASLFVELVDVQTQESIVVARKVKPDDIKVEWNIEPHFGTMVVIRINDGTTTGWVGIREPVSADVKLTP